MGSRAKLGFAKAVIAEASCATEVGVAMQMEFGIEKKSNLDKEQNSGWRVQKGGN